jgi:hypothetical protein
MKFGLSMFGLSRRYPGPSRPRAMRSVQDVTDVTARDTEDLIASA